MFAHSANASGRWQLLEDHLRQVGDFAAEFASAFGGADVARWLGWWHDVGKASEAFQRYLRDPSAAHGPDHSSAGAVHVAADCPPLAMVPAGHHVGLVDASELVGRLRAKRDDATVTAALELATRLLGSGCPAPDLTVVSRLLRSPEPEAKTRAALLVRMLHSAVVDADCLDTERHFAPDQSSLRGATDGLRALWDRLEADQARLSAGAPAALVNRCRREVYAACLAAAERAPGFFRLTVPTGGGKTRSSTAFALRHALAHGQRRVIVALPYTSIIEQTCDVYRGIFGDEAVLEHHSAVAAPTEDTDLAERRDRLAADNWDAPLIVTTNVQLFESLFAARNSRLRKLHNIACSVIILDEVQTLPIELLAPTLTALRLLVEDYGCTAVLSSATQPAFEQREGLPTGIVNAHEIVADHARHFRELARVAYEVPADAAETLSWDEVADAACSEPQALVVLNTIADALDVFDRMPSEGRFHLSASMCGAHRRAVLAEVRRRLAAGEPCRLVSTQVVEAGVDLDFPLVMRALAGLDRIAQAAGRCNREGRGGVGRVVVFRPSAGHLPPGTYRTAADTTETMLADGPLDLHDPVAFERFFRLLHSRKDLDEPGVGALISGWKFRSAAEKYRFIKEETHPVVVIYLPEAERVRELLYRVRTQRSVTRGMWRRLQPYVVSMRAEAVATAAGAGEAVSLTDELFLWQGGYDGERGVVRANWAPCDLVV